MSDVRRTDWLPVGMDPNSNEQLHPGAMSESEWEDDRDDSDEQESDDRSGDDRADDCNAFARAAIDHNVDEETQCDEDGGAVADWDPVIEAEPLYEDASALFGT